MTLKTKRSSYGRLPAVLAAITGGYFVFAMAVIASFNLGLPPGLELVLSLAAAPAVLLLLVWNPVLRPLGLLAGDAVSMPNGWACAVLVALYAGLAFTLASAVQRFWRRGA